MELTLVPAYGRDYKTAEEAKQAWEEGKDFKIESIFSTQRGRYCSIRDSSKLPGEHVRIRFNRFNDVILVNLIKE